jgi:hypothetical protein
VSRWFAEQPSLPEAVAAVISLLAIGLIGWLAVAENNAAAQTALVSLAGAAAGTYFTPRSNGNGNGNGKHASTTESSTPPPVRTT